MFSPHSFRFNMFTFLLTYKLGFIIKAKNKTNVYIFHLPCNNVRYKNYCGKHAAKKVNLIKVHSVWFNLISITDGHYVASCQLLKLNLQIQT